MNSKIKQAWVEALRSGDYMQGDSMLRQATKGGPVFCCLGVLTDIYLKESGKEWSDCDSADNQFESNEIMSPEVVKWAEFATIDGNGPMIIHDHSQTFLSCLNDELCLSFNEIAGLIENQF